MSGSRGALLVAQPFSHQRGQTTRYRWYWPKKRMSASVGWSAMIGTVGEQNTLVKSQRSVGGWLSTEHSWVPATQSSTSHRWRGESRRSGWEAGGITTPTKDETAETPGDGKSQVWSDSRWVQKVRPLCRLECGRQKKLNLQTFKKEPMKTFDFLILQQIAIKKSKKPHFNNADEK